LKTTLKHIFQKLPQSIDAKEPTEQCPLWDFEIIFWKE
jgi:hypothetical protein